MGDLSLWDILFLRDELTTEQYLILEWAIPIALSVIALVGFALYLYWWDIKGWFRRHIRRKKR